MSTDRIILDYNDSLLHGSDLHLLQPNNWLNDRIIGFVYEYYEREFFAEIVQKQKITLVNPSTVQFLKLCESLDEAIMCFFEPLELDKKNFIFFPLNNSVVTDAAGGSHWSLGLLNRKTSTFSHYDSFGGSNSSEAVKFFQKFKAYFKIDKFVDEKEFPQQQNTSDCGVYVIGKYFCVST